MVPIRLTRRALLTLPAAVGAAALAGAAPAQEARPVTVVELFTSQGCSSCPPSDAYLGELSKRPDVLALSFHVDYWDYIGWRDPFAAAQFTERQRGYARSLKQRYVYTPEMVVQGRGHDSGIDRGAIRDLIAEAQKPEHPRLAPRIVDRGAAGVSVALPAFQAPQPCDVWLVTYDPEHRTKVLRGENRGRDLTNTNVVRSLALLATWDGAPTELRIAADRLGAARGVAILVQHPDLGPILGAAALTRASAD
ncbi:MAG: DUF1223 domain-containing protein [Reyranellaceae bacterium]